MSDLVYSPTELFLLSDESLLNFSVKENVFLDLSQEVLSNVARLRDIDAHAICVEHKIFRQTGIGKGDTNQVNSVHRGDLRCWVTPDLCRDHGLNGIQTLVKRLIKSCFSLKTKHQLNGDYSVQLTIYVSLRLKYIYDFLILPFSISLEMEHIMSNIWTPSPRRTPPLLLAAIAA